MKIKTVWSVYFSGTGTTEKVVTSIAKTMAQALDAEYKSFSFNLPAARADELSFTADDLVVLGTPVYAGRVPNLLLPYLQEKVKGNGALGVPVVLYGNRNFDDGLMELKNVMRDNGFHPVAAAAVVGEHSFSRILGAGRPDAEDRRPLRRSRLFRPLPPRPSRWPAATLSAPTTLPVTAMASPSVTS